MKSELIFDPILPIPLIILLAVFLFVLTLYLYLRTGSPISLSRNIVLIFLRVAGLSLVLVLLLQPSRKELLPPITKQRIILIGVDTSSSMRQRDVEGKTRFDAVRKLLMESGVINEAGLAKNQRIRIFEFSDDARAIEKSIMEIVPNGKTTRFDKSVSTMLKAHHSGEAIHSVILLSDGHDFELINPVKTGSVAHSQKIPVHAIAFGKQGKVRDIGVRITGYQPYAYVKQKARISAALRFIGCEFENINAQLLRNGKMMESKRLNAGEAQELPIEFEVIETNVGQYEYEVRVLPLEEEIQNANNSAITYLNIIDQQIRVLMIEGDPYWDTTFLQRSLMRNDKFDVDVLTSYGKERLRAIRKNQGFGELKPPDSIDQFANYDVIILGRNVDRIFNDSQITSLGEFIKNRAGTVVFSRGHAFGNEDNVNELEPIQWSQEFRSGVRFDVAPEGRAIAAFRILNDSDGGIAALPELLQGNISKEKEPLTSVLAVFGGQDDVEQLPAVVHRRFGRGQVVSIGVNGLWRWTLNASISAINSPFDRFWDQMILWLLASRDFMPSGPYSFRPNSANVMLGEKAHFYLTFRKPNPDVNALPLTIYLNDQEIGRANMTSTVSDIGRLSTEFLPEKTGRYRAVVLLPDGSTQESRFIVFSENLEETEVATDTLYLRRLTESSGGRLIEAAALPKLLKELNNENVDVDSRTQLKPIWNHLGVFYLVALFFGLDWLMRRRWGLS